MEMTEEADSAIGENLANVRLGELLFVEKFRKPLLEFSITVFLRSGNLFMVNFAEEVEGVPQGVHNVSYLLVCLKLQVLLRENEAVDDVVGDPLELVRFITVFILVPVLQVRHMT